MRESRKIKVLLPKSLEANYRKEIQNRSPEIYMRTSKWRFVPIRDAELDKYASESKIPRKTLEENAGIWIVDNESGREGSVLTDDEKTKFANQVVSMLDKQIEYVRYNGLREDSAKRLDFDDCLIIVDEFHNLVSQIANENDIGMILYHKLRDSNARIVALSGTPIVNYSHEVAIIANILRGGVLLQTRRFTKPESMDNSKVIDLVSRDPIIGFVDIGRANVKGKGVQLVLQYELTPPGFRQIYEGDVYVGLLKDETGEELHEDAHRKLADRLKEHGIILNMKGSFKDK